MSIAQYIIVRKDIIEKHGFGFIAAQIGHASVAPITNPIRTSSHESQIINILDKETLEWIDKTFFKIVLGVENLDKLIEIQLLLDKDGIKYCPIVESKINQLTCIGLKPYEKNDVSKYFSDLKKL